MNSELTRIEREISLCVVKIDRAVKSGVAFHYQIEKLDNLVKEELQILKTFMNHNVMRRH